MYNPSISLDMILKPVVKWQKHRDKHWKRDEKKNRKKERMNEWEWDKAGGR